jgi:hypothetical protein
VLWKRKVGLVGGRNGSFRQESEFRGELRRKVSF